MPPTVLEIKNPRRILALSPPDSGILGFLKGKNETPVPYPPPPPYPHKTHPSDSTSIDLTGSAPTITDGDSTAGLSHSWTISTAYYSATLPIWIDEMTSPEAWSTDFRTPEAKEVLAVIAAVVFCFKKPVDVEDLNMLKRCLHAVHDVIKEGCDPGWEGVCLAVAMPQSTTPYLDKSMEELEDEMGLGASMEFVDLASRGRNEYGERTGIDRIREALEANEWDDAGDQGELDLDELLDATTGDTHDGDDDVNAATGFLDEANELQLEMVGMHAAIFDNDPPLGGATARPVGEDGEGGDDASKASKTKEETDDDDEEAQVEQLEVALAKMHAIRDMPAAQRRKYAAQAFRDALRSL